MAKRYTDTDKYKKLFIRNLPSSYKLFWDYLYHDCNHAGIWHVDFEVANIYIGKDFNVNYEDAIKYFNTDEIRIVELNNKSKWFLPSFIDFQYGELNIKNRVHASVINILGQYELDKYKGLARGLLGSKDKDKDKDMEKDKDLYYRLFCNLYSIEEDNFNCKYLFDELTIEEIEKIFKTLPLYINSVDDKKYLKKTS